MDTLIVVLVVLGIVLAMVVSWFIKRYKRCPSDKILVVFGKVGKNASGDRTAKCIHGGAAFVWPVIQDSEFLDLTPIPINVDLRNALSKQNIRVNVPCRFMVAICPEDGVVQNAAERLLGLNPKTIHDLASDVIIGQLRQVIATMEIEEINSDREKFAANVSDAVGHELRKIGLQLINVNVTDITDEGGYIESLGKEATAKAKNDALRIVAEKEKEGAIGQANARREQRIQVAAANSEAQIGEADAQMKQRIQVAKANSEAVEGENTAKITIANSNADRRKAESEAERIAMSAEKINEAETLRASYEAQKTAELARAEKKRASQEADVVVPAEVDKKRIEIEAEAEAERIRRIAKGNADSIYYEMEAKAKGLMEILQKQAQGFQSIVKSAGDNPNDAIKLMIADKITEIVKLQTEAVQNLKIDKVTVWDSMSGGKSSTANFLSGMLGSLPPLNDIFKSAGLELPDYLKGKQTAESVQVAPEAEPAAETKADQVEG